MVEYSKEQFYKDVNQWINKQVKFMLTEDWGDDSSWNIVLDSYNCHLEDGHLSIWKPCFALELYDEDFKVYIDDDYNVDIYEFPLYYIQVRNAAGKFDLNENKITIEIL